MNAAPHRVGRPLDADSARMRAQQAAALGDSAALRVLSALAAGVAAPDLAGVLFLSAERAEEALLRLASVGLIHPDGADGYALNGETWVRFGRLLVEAPPQHSGDEPATPRPTALPVAIASVARNLSYRFSSTFSPETVSRYVAESYLLLSERARVRTHLAALTARYAADRLDALASAQGLILRDTPEVLFVCVQNAGRSQLAAAFLRHLAGDRVHVRTAGSAPAGEVHPRIIAALDEVGVPISDEYPKPLTDEVVQAADYVVTMGCGDACPVYPGRRYSDWDLPDPLDLDEDGMRLVRDEIRTRIDDLLIELGFDR
ncbi:arsenate reductase ArsC [Microbacterium xanthum]|uniref:arsenate reductase ArsC n=1 Tax=Microbacterium xanthum TaxID=3079794 RepID=UPI002AD36CF8|nr:MULTISPECIES: arsenate reductase ArsC [unclassified Microbacterium]MDZ8170824.1 arsenate reductase ArsC [Microbacterium sp. KSW-48]MDZ8201333.1 arsenate reductase ArsC [Microbacterium sp. SSW1-59]